MSNNLVLDVICDLQEEGSVQMTYESHGFGYVKIAYAIRTFFSGLHISYSFNHSILDKKGMDFFRNQFDLKLRKENSEEKLLGIKAIRSLRETGQIVISAESYASDYVWIARFVANLLRYFEIDHQMTTENSNGKVIYIIDSLSAMKSEQEAA